MKELTSIALNVARDAGADFADMRIVEERKNRIYVERLSVKLIDETESVGYGVRVLLGGSWGYASSTDLTTDGVATTANLAVQMAQASARVPGAERARMCPGEPHNDTRVSPCLEDPFAVSNREKGELLLEACGNALKVSDIAMVWGWFRFIRTRRVIANTDGSFLDLTDTVSEPQFEVTASVKGESQSRTYMEGARQGGYEFIRQVDLIANARRWAEEAVITCRAEDCPSGVMDIVCDPMNLALTMHESVGHPTELDRILGWEANMAGRSFVNPEMLGDFQYGSELTNFTADNLLDGGLGSWFYDDDGVKLHSFPVIKDGVIVDLAVTRETAPLIGRNTSNGCCRSDGFTHFPINRIPNLYMEPGADDSVTADDLIAGVDRGVYFQGRGSFSIDQMRNNFQFGGDMFWLIEGGKRTRPLKKAIYQAQTTQFWRSCDGVAGKSDWRPFGLMNCGKGEPMQAMRMTHGASTCRFRDIAVGGAKI